MNITKENIDALNAVVKVEISAADYQEKVDKILQDYRKTNPRDIDIACNHHDFGLVFIGYQCFNYYVSRQSYRWFLCIWLLDSLII